MSLLRRFLLTILLFSQTYLSAQATAPPQENRKTSTPYTGDLSVFDSPGRDERLQIDRVMDILAVTPGKNVADIGAGSGWFTIRAAHRVADRGTVYALDINPAEIGRASCRERV